jgi:hypothetical protein
LHRREHELDFGPYGCVALGKLYRRITWHDSFVLQLK